jgi:catechol 2,3-dioxygenase-like lactoylglutathione lyase family enzyme
MRARLNHLHLHVRSVERARRFYERWFGLREHARHGEILFLRDADDGLDLALAPAAELEAFPAWFHFGFRLGDAASVRALHGEMSAAGERVLTPFAEEPGFACFRCADPDGYAIEVYWE